MALLDQAGDVLAAWVKVGAFAGNLPGLEDTPELIAKSKRLLYGLGVLSGTLRRINS